LEFTLEINAFDRLKMIVPFIFLYYIQAKYEIVAIKEN